MPTEPPDFLILGDCLVSLTSGSVLRGDEPAQLSRRELALLRFLAANSGRDVPREELLVHVWGYSPYMRTRVVDNTIRRLRVSVGDNGVVPRFLHTVYGIGYRLELASENEEPRQPLEAPVSALEQLCGDEDELQHATRACERLGTSLVLSGLETDRAALWRAIGAEHLSTRHVAVWERMSDDGRAAAIAASLFDGPFPSAALKHLIPGVSFEELVRLHECGWLSTDSRALSRMHPTARELVRDHARGALAHQLLDAVAPSLEALSNAIAPPLLEPERLATTRSFAHALSTLGDLLTAEADHARLALWSHPYLFLLGPTQVHQDLIGRAMDGRGTLSPQTICALEFCEIQRLHERGELASASSRLMDLISTAAASDALRRRALILSAAVLNSQREHQQAVELLEKLQQEVPSDAPPNLVGHLHLTLGHAHRGLGAFGDAREAFNRAIALFQASGDSFREVTVRFSLGQLLSARGLHELGAIQLRHCAGPLALLGPATRAAIQQTLGNTVARGGAFEEGERHLRNSLAEGDATPAQIQFAARDVLGWLALASARDEVAREMIDASSLLLGSLGDAHHHARLLLLQTALHVLGGDLTAARRAASSGLDEGQPDPKSDALLEAWRALAREDLSTLTRLGRDAPEDIAAAIRAWLAGEPLDAPPLELRALARLTPPRAP